MEIGDFKFDCGYKRGSKGVVPLIINKKHNIEVVLGSERMKPFGYYVAGCELGAIGNEKNAEPIEVLKSTIMDALAEELKQSQRAVGYHTIRDFLRNKYVAKSKIEANSIERVLFILQDNYQQLCRNREIEVEEEKIMSNP